jgi:hypothetical protein
MKKIIIAAVIIFFILVGIVGSITEDPETKNKSVKKTQTSKPTEKPTKKPTKKPVKTSKPIKNLQTSKPKPKEKNILIDGLSVRPVMNGTGDKAIGKYGYVRISKETFKILCNDKVLINFVKKVVKKDLLYVIINFGDGTGLHGLESLYTYCEISKDKNGVFEGGGYLGNLKIYFDTNKVDRTNLKF